MKDFSRIALLAALVLLVFVLSSVDVSFSAGHLHFGWLRRLLPMLLIAWAIWMVCRGRCCCRRNGACATPDAEDDGA